MPLLGGAQAVEQLDAGGLRPAVVELGREGLAGRGRQPQAAQAREVAVQQRGQHRGDGDQHGRAVAGDAREEPLGRGVLAEEHRRATGGEREEQRRAGRIAEVEARHRDRDVAVGEAEDAEAVAVGAVEEAARGLHDRLGRAGGPAAEEPDGRVVGVGRDRVDGARVGHVAHGEVAATVDGQQQRRVHAGGCRGVAHVVGERVGGDDRTGSGVPEDPGQRVGGQRRVDHHDDRGALDDPEERGHEVLAVGQRDQHPLLGADVQPRRARRPCDRPRCSTSA